MKLFYLHIIIILALVGCNEPAPIELISESDPQTEIEIINKDASSYTLTGYDSTGIVNDFTLNKSIVSYSGIKNTFKNVTTYKGHGEAIFFDTSKPILNSSNRIIGYKTFDIGEVIFDKEVSEVVPFRLKYYDKFKLTDTLIGLKHVFDKRGVLLPAQFNFPFGKTIPIYFSDKVGNKTLIPMRIPSEIIGELKLKGSMETDDLELILNWNKNDLSVDEIIIGGIIKGSRELVPLFRIKDQKKERSTLSNNLIKQIPFRNFSHLVVTFIRKNIEKQTSSKLGDIYFASQSIHNIWIEI